MTKAPLPDQIPIFPLTGAILLPKGNLPLYIFEQRYKEMIYYSLKHSGFLGMIQPSVTVKPKSTSENDLYGTEPTGRDLYKIGGLGVISEFEQLNDGRFLIIVTGLSRFNIIKELPRKNKFRLVHACYDNFPNDNVENIDYIIKNRGLFIKEIISYFSAVSMSIDMDGFQDSDDEELINSIAMICPFEPAEKQLLLETPTINERFKLLLKIMKINLISNTTSINNIIH